jgi:hypothetical protein
MNNHSDTNVLRELAKQYIEVASSDGQRERRRLWLDHNSLRPTRVPVLATFGMWNVWCREVFSDAAMACQDPFYRAHERTLRMNLFAAATGDDSVLEPWLTQHATKVRGWSSVWGVEDKHSERVEGGSWQFRPAVATWDDVAKLSPPPHQVDEPATARDADRLREAVGDILPVHVERGPVCQGFLSDLSYSVTQLRGLEQLMIDMYESPKELHALMAFLRDGVLANQTAAEAAGDLSPNSSNNQCHPYADATLKPTPNVYRCKRSQLWSYMAAQEFELISPAQHEEFLLQYQLPIMARWGLAAYGCCENLTRKIDMLRQVPNLRIIAVTPRADVRQCAEQIGSDYVMSWRPNPADMICCQFDEALIRRIIRSGLDASRGCRVHIHLKDIETVQGQPDRLERWVRIVREVADDVAA